jgi:hypothetical protein
VSNAPRCGWLGVGVEPEPEALSLPPQALSSRQVSNGKKRIARKVHPLGMNADEDGNETRERPQRFTANAVDCAAPCWNLLLGSVVRPLPLSILTAGDPSYSCAITRRTGFRRH